MSEKRRKQVRVLHAPLNYANQAYILSEALRQEGIDSSLLTYAWGDAVDKYQFNEDTSAPVAFRSWLGDEFDILGKVVNGSYDILHYWNRSLVYHGGGDNFFNGLDLPYARLAGLHTAYRFTGYELRRKSLELEVNPFSPFRYGFESRHKEDEQQRYLDHIAPYIDAFIVQDPEMQTYFQQARIVPRALDLKSFPVAMEAPHARPLVVHAPTNRLLKGSDFVLKAVETLTAQGLAFEFKLIEDMPQADAFEWYRRADIVVDQLLIGWYGVVALEAMAMGKTVIAYIRDDLTGFFQGEMPLLTANPETIAPVLRAAIGDAHLRREIGGKGRAFVERVHDSRIVARDLARLYRELLEAPAAPVRTQDFAYQAGCAGDVVGELSLAQAARSRHIPALHKAQFRLKELERELRVLENQNAALGRDAEFFRENTIVNRYLRFARHCHERAAELKAEAYSAYGVEALPAADAVAKSVGGRVYCDVIETPSFAHRSATIAWHPTNLALLDHAFEGFLKGADGLLTVGWALKGEIEPYGRPVSVIPNYRYAEDFTPTARLRERCGLHPQDRLVLSISTITGGFETILEALALLPADVHLATLGTFVPAAYEEKIRDLAASLDIERRVHLFAPVSYDQLAATASGADVGLIALDPTVANHRLSLPNRLFDYMAAGLPVVAPDIADIARILKEREFGVVLRRVSARHWANGIEAALAGEEAMRANARAAAKDLVWESLGDPLHAAYGNPSSITFVGYRDLTRNQRTMRIARTLAERGVAVTVCCPHEGPEVKSMGIRFVLTPPLVHAAREAAPSARARPAEAEIPTEKSREGPPQKPAAANGRASPETFSQTAAEIGAQTAAFAQRGLELRDAKTKERQLKRQLDSLRIKHQEVTEKELLPLRYKARQYDEVFAELPALRFKALQYDKVKDELPTWRAKAARYDRLVAKRRWLWLPLTEPVLRRIQGLAELLRSRPTPAPAGRSKAIAPARPAAAAAPDGGPPAASGKGHVCILSRKDLRDITRVPRMAKALIDEGYAVTVVSFRAPVRQLQDMCPETVYIPVAPQPVTGKLLGRINRKLTLRRNERLKREEADRNTIGEGGARAVALRGRRAAIVPFRWVAERVRRIFVVAPCTLMLKKRNQSLAAAWRDNAGKETLQVLAPFLGQLHQWAMTHAFADEADLATRDRRFDVVQAHDNYALVAAARLAARDNAKLVYDAVELSSHRLAINLSRYEVLREWYERREESRIFRKADALTTVGEGLATWYATNYRVRRPLVVRNCRYFWPYERDFRLRADAGIGEDVRLVIWFGSAYPQQGIELLIDAVPLLSPDIHVAIVATALPAWVSYVNEELPRRAADLGVGDRVHILPPRGPNDLVAYVSGADIGIIPRPSEHLNNFFSMPNKFLEMVMARLPVAASRLGDIVDAIRHYDFGDVFDERDPREIAATIERMFDPAAYARLKANIMQAAEEMSWEKESVRYVALVAGLMPTATAVPAPAAADAERTAA